MHPTSPTPPTGGEAERLEGLREDAPYVLIKRGLYWRPNGQGYTGVLDQAGRYTADEAAAHEHHGAPSTRKAMASEVPRFSEACWPEIKQEILEADIAARDAELADLRRQVAEAEAGWNAATNARLEADDRANAWRLESAAATARATEAEARASAMEKALRQIAKNDYGLQGLIEDGSSHDDIQQYLHRQIIRRQQVARAALSPADPSQSAEGAEKGGAAS